MMMTGCEGNNPGDCNESAISRQRRAREEELYDMFYIFDKDRSGYISSDELSDVMIRFGNLSEKEVAIMLADADIDGDGQVNRFYTLLSWWNIYSFLNLCILNNTYCEIYFHR